MDKETYIKWGTQAAVRGLAWAGASYLGWNATQAQTSAEMLVQGVSAIVIVGISVYNSIQQRKKLLLMKPPTE